MRSEAMSRLINAIVAYLERRAAIKYCGHEWKRKICTNKYSAESGVTEDDTKGALPYAADELWICSKCGKMHERRL